MTISADQPTVLAVDVGGTKTALGLVRSDGSVLASHRAPARAERGPGPMLADYIAAGRALLQTDAGRAVAGVGVGCGGPLDPRTGTIYGPPNLPGWDRVPLAAQLRAALGLPVWVENDANAGALGEYLFGAGAQCDPLVYLTVSTGVGGGVILDGHVLHGATGNAAEFGHLIVVPDGRACACGQRGCLEAYCSGSSIAARAGERLHSGEPSSLTGLGGAPRAEDVVQAALAGDAVATSVWDETVERLATGIADAVHSFDPQRVVLGGGVTSAGDALFVPLRRAVERLVLPHFRPHLEIRTAALGEDVGLVGAAAVAFHQLALSTAVK